LLAALLAAAPAAAVLVPSDAQASVSIAIPFDALVKDADSVGIATPVESKSVWEDGRIYTYTRLKVEQGVAGELGTGAEGWVRTMGGVSRPASLLSSSCGSSRPAPGRSRHARRASTPCSSTTR
jgi:hypothetical protein